MAYHTLNLLSWQLPNHDERSSQPLLRRRRRRGLRLQPPRTLADAVVVSACFRRMTTSITYSIAAVTELMSPLETLRLTSRPDADVQSSGRFSIKGSSW